MIYKQFPSTRKGWVDKFLPVQQQQQKTNLPAGTSLTEERPNTSDKKRAAQFKIAPEEFVRRDKIVRALFLECPFHVGEALNPLKQADREKYGVCNVRGVWKSYHDFPTLEAMEWPKDDYPYILTVQPTKKQDDGTELILCHQGFLTRSVQ